MDSLHVVFDTFYIHAVLYTVFVFLVGVFSMHLRLWKGVVIIFMLIMFIFPAAYADENHLTLGLYTRHYENYSDELNEDNRLTQLTHVTDDGYMVVGSTFINSHGVRTYAVGGGVASDNMGFAIIAVHGYEDYLRQHYKGIMFAPTSYYLHNIQGNHSIKINLVPTVYNVGYNYRF